MVQGLSETGHLEVVSVQDVGQDLDSLLLQLLQDLWGHTKQPNVEREPPPPGLADIRGRGRAWWQFLNVFSSLSRAWWPSALMWKYSSSTCAWARADLVSLFNICVQGQSEMAFSLSAPPSRGGCSGSTCLLLLFLRADLLVSLHEVEQGLVFPRQSGQLLLHLFAEETNDPPCQGSDLPGHRKDGGHQSPGPGGAGVHIPDLEALKTFKGLPGTRFSGNPPPEPNRPCRGISGGAKGSPCPGVAGRQSVPLVSDSKCVPPPLTLSCSFQLRVTSFPVRSMAPLNWGSREQTGEAPVTRTLRRQRPGNGRSYGPLPLGVLVQKLPQFHNGFLLKRVPQ